MKGMNIRCVLAAAVAAVASHALPAADRIAEIVFDEQPKEQGMRFLREYCQPEQVEVNGEKVWAWKFYAGSYPDQMWTHDARFELTDPAFKNGAMPVIRGEIEYLHTSDTTFDIFVDTGDGVKSCGCIWGASREFRTLKFTCDNTFFGCRGKVDKGGNFDLQAKAYNSPIFIRRIRLVGMDLDDSPDFSRLLRVAFVHAPNRRVAYFDRSEQVRLVHRFSNHARVAFKGAAAIRYEDLGGRLLAEAKREITVPANAEADIAFDFDAGTLPLGVYFTRLKVVPAGEEKPCIEREGSFALGASAKFRRPERGEFLYGADLTYGHAPRIPELIDWAKLMGVNIIRYGVDRGNEDLYVRDALRLRADGIETVAICDVSKIDDHDRFCLEQEDINAFCQRYCRKAHPPYWELGNEPDLSFFFPVGIIRYLEGFYMMRDAIKEADPKTMVMNGGVANVPFSDESKERTRLFMERIKPEKIDYIAYHAHGPGYIAERDNLNKLLAHAEKYGKTGLPYCDTETGVAVSGRDEKLLQASTCVQKFMHALEHRQPFLLWFRLLFEEQNSYGNLFTPQEPRPVVLAYRSMVTRLRDFDFAGRVELQDDAVKVFLFRERKGGRRRVAVCWTEKPEIGAVILSRANGFASALLYDLFGNARTVSADAGRFAVEVSPVPVYLTWSDAASGERVSAEIGARTEEKVAAGELVLDGSSVENFFLCEPDVSRYWKGADDLSAIVTARYTDGDAVKVVVTVRDSKHRPPSAALGPKGDFVEVRDAEGHVFKAALDAAKKTLTAGGGITKIRKEKESSLVYELTLPAGVAMPLTVDVHDDDFGAPKQHAFGRVSAVK